MSKLELVKKNLLGQEVDFCELDNNMMEMGFLSEANSGIWDNCLQDGNIVYYESTDELGNTEATTQVFFETVIEARENEVSESAIVRITNIEKF